MSAAPITTYRADRAERAAQAVLDRLDRDNLVRAHGRYRWVSDGAVESGSRVARLRQCGVLGVVAGIVVRRCSGGMAA